MPESNPGKAHSRFYMTLLNGYYYLVILDVPLLWVPKLFLEVGSCSVKHYISRGLHAFMIG